MKLYWTAPQHNEDSYNHNLFMGLRVNKGPSEQDYKGIERKLRAVVGHTRC